MKRHILTAALVAFAASNAVAQSSTTEGETPAIATPDSQNPTAPVAGENSFTEDQVRERLKDAGFGEVTNLTLGNDGVWRGMATSNGKQTNIAMDYQGNITTQ
ncbi:PepSY domain-containing protein [Rhizobiaceae bacterium n13]|uniref:PepSY domain-containing protein n=1 Tax=Ferirhizobium litorale TaxID=2927786 RepID=A0AAE3QD95_9HYPH|nr:PepSY domain-containing protein [Fererhizobium litorale]MDI7865221.1 PepSY domain-containing protein [Fererhizobium litorale]MDI7922831.1 PepSY domain-containing protein [Fererhizobium litorale]